MNTELITDIFTYHPPKPDQIATYEQINQLFLNLAQQLLENLLNAECKQMLQLRSKVNFNAESQMATK